MRSRRAGSETPTVSAIVCRIPPGPSLILILVSLSSAQIVSESTRTLRFLTTIYLATDTLLFKCCCSTDSTSRQTVRAE